MRTRQYSKQLPNVDQTCQRVNLAGDKIRFSYYCTIILIEERTFILRDIMAKSGDKKRLEENKLHLQRLRISIAVASVR